jgi:glycopeptide antibiotics resistance protein
VILKQVSISYRRLRTFCLIYTVGLLIVSVLPINGEGSSLNNNYIFNLRWDYVLHGVVLIPLGIMLDSLVQKTKLQSKTLGLLIGLSLAIIVELIQLYIPFRTFNINDLFANVLGVSLGYLLGIIIQKLWN